MLEEKTEIWKSLDFIEYPNYEISSWGQVKSLNYNKTGKEKILKQGKCKNKYMYVSLCKKGKRKSFTVHRLVCLAFLENPLNLPCVNHKDENPSNNHVNNLEFCNHTYNMNYGTIIERKSKSMKGKMSGENNPMYGKISSRRKPILQYSLLGEFIKEYESTTTASKELGISITSINNALKGRSETAGNYKWFYK